MQIATVRWPSGEFTAEPVKQLDGGAWLMRALQHTSRFSIDTIVLVRKTEILSVVDE